MLQIPIALVAYAVGLLRFLTVTSDDTILILMAFLYEILPKLPH